MAKPKPSEKMVYIGFTIAESEKTVWENFAVELGFPLARIIKETMNQRINMPSVSSNQQSDKFSKIIFDEINQLRNEISELNVKYLDAIKSAPISESVNVIDTENIKKRVRILLCDLKTITREKLQDYLDVDSKMMRKILTEMKDSNEIDYNPETQTWGKI